MTVKPSVFGRAGSADPPTVNVIPVAVSVPVSARPPVGGGPSPISSVAVPLKVSVPPAIDPLVIEPSTLMIWYKPMALMPVNSA